MNDILEKRVRTAAVAGWWALLIAAGFIFLQWVAYLLIMSSRPAWILLLFGSDLGWNFLQNVWFYTAAIFKLYIWMLAVVVVWLTFWARLLR